MLRATSRSTSNNNDDNAMAKADEMVKSAKRKLQDSQFQDAELLFTKAIKLDPQNLKAYEGRVVSYERRGDLQKALSDARNIIKSFPKHAQGYLRCGKVLRLLDRNEDAVGIYKAGLLMVPKDDKLFSELEKQYEALLEGSRKLTASTLPVEIITHLYRKLADPLPLACSSKANLGAFRQSLISSRTLRIHSKLKAASLKVFLPTKNAILIKGSTALKNLLIAVKAGTECEVEMCQFVDCNRVDPFDLSRAVSLGFFKSIKSIIVCGDTSDILIAATLSKVEYLTSLSFLNVHNNTLPATIQLGRLKSFFAVDSSFCKPIAQLLSGQEMSSVHWDAPVDHVWNCSDYANYIFDNQSSLERLLNNQSIPTKWIDIQFDAPLMPISIERLLCKKVSIFNGLISVNESTTIEQLYLKQCKVSEVDWGKLSCLKALWMESCVDGLEEQCLEALSQLPKLKELIIVSSPLRCPYLPATLTSLIPRLRVFGAVECSTISGPALDGCDHVVQIKTRAEFEFIKKKRWSIMDMNSFTEVLS